jgi:hypothetical protein
VFTFKIRIPTFILANDWSKEWSNAIPGGNRRNSVTKGREHQWIYVTKNKHLKHSRISLSDLKISYNACGLNFSYTYRLRVSMKEKLSHNSPWRHLMIQKVWFLFILNLGTRRWWEASVTPLPRFTPGGKDPRYLAYRRLGGPQSRSGHRGNRKNPLPLPGIESR